MTEVSENDWRPRARALADLVAPRSPTWWHALSETPRHVFVPEFWDLAKNPPALVTRASPYWLEAVYTDKALTTQLQQHPEHTGLWLPTSSTTAPSLMVSMLEALDLEPEHRVLELGTGTGYNASLLCTLLEVSGMFSVDLDPTLVSAALERLSSIGHRPTLVVGDSVDGHQPGAPYDRVIATHAVEEVPYTWVEQTRPGGAILTDVRSASSPGIGRIARLEVREDGTARGHFRHADTGGFMSARTNADHPDTYFGLLARDLRDANRRRTDIDVNVLGDPHFRFALWAHNPELTISPNPDATVSTRDGSWVSAAHSREVDVAGPVDLWAVVEEIYSQWCTSGKPRVEDFTITVTPEGQTITPG
jgi:protein-L-isoaspartate(D-aspartate) O-methyltransferase